MEYRTKLEIFNSNVYICKFGDLKHLQIYKRDPKEPVKLIYEENFFCGEPIDIPNVLVYEVDSASLGLTYYLNKFNPVIVNLVDEKFDGTSKDRIDDIRDEQLYLRSDLFNYYFKKGLFPLKENEVIYTKDVLFFRDEMMNRIKPSFLSVITTCAVKNPKLINDNFNLTDYETTFERIGAIFQTGFIMKHDTLILNSFGCNEKDKNPIDDTLEIFNYYIIKFGYVFKNIVFCVPPVGQYGVEVMKRFARDVNTIKELRKE